jgi:transcriptional regulator with XRE-family HTH domain
MPNRPKAYDAIGLSRLERLKRYHGLTLRGMEERTGVPRSTLSRVMRGHSPDVLVALKIAAVFQVTVEQLWGDLVKSLNAAASGIDAK